MLPRYLVTYRPFDGTTLYAGLNGQNTVVALDPASAHPHENLAMLHARRKRWRDALLAHLKAVEVEPASPGARFTLAVANAAPDSPASVETTGGFYSSLYTFNPDTGVLTLGPVGGTWAKLRSYFGSGK